MAGRRGSSLVGLVVTAVIAVPSMALVLQNSFDNTQNHKLELTSASGAVSIANSREGQAILQARPMLPGQVTTGTVQLSNTGDGAETMTLDAGDPVDQPGPGGGHLSQRLLLRIDDISSGSAHTVYNGSLSGLHGADLGTWSKDESRTYRFVVTFPDGGANGADNAYQGSAATIGFTWTAGAAGPAAPAADAPYDEQIAYDNPIGYWSLDGSQADMGDAAGGHDGQFSNSVTTAEVGAPGGGLASAFDGTTSYGYVPSVTAPASGYTLEAWVWPADTGDQMIVDHGGGPALGIRGGHFFFRQTSTILTSSTTVEAGRWWHLVGTWDASTQDARFYVDGHLSAETGSTATPSGSSTFYVGRGSWTGGGSGREFFHGNLADVGYYDAPLDPDRVQAHWAAANPDAGPIATPPGDSGGPSGGTPGSSDGGSPPPSGGGTTTTPATTPSNDCPKVVATGGKGKPKPKPKPKKKPKHKKPKHKKKAAPKKTRGTQRTCAAPTGKRATG